jgi:hypothetical protein
MECKNSLDPPLIIRWEATLVINIIVLNGFRTRRSRLMFIAGIIRMAGGYFRLPKQAHPRSNGACRERIPRGLDRRAWRPRLPSSYWLLQTLQPEGIVDGDLLLRSQVTFGGLDRAVAEQELDVFEVAATPAAELGAGAAKVVRSEAFDADLLGCLLHHRPDRPGSQALPDPAVLADGAQKPALLHSGRRDPGVDPLLDPYRHGDGPDPAALAAEVAITQRPSRIWISSIYRYRCPL